jgi:hypothetical protein
MDWRTIEELAPDGASLLGGLSRFLGYIPQRFKEYGQTMAHETRMYLRQIRKRVYEDIAAVLRKVDQRLAREASADPVVGQVKDLASLVQTAQREGVALWECPSTYVDRKDNAKKAFADIASHILESMTSRTRRTTARGR